MLWLISSFTSYSCSNKNIEFASVLNNVKDKISDSLSADTILKEIYRSISQEAIEKIYSEKELSHIFDLLRNKHVLLVIIEREYQKLLKGIEYLNQLDKEGKKLTIFDLWKYVISRFVSIYSISVYSFYLYLNKDKKTREYYSYSNTSNILLYPGDMLSYIHQGYCMNKTLGAPHNGDMLILRSVDSLSISNDLRQIIKCIIKNYKQFTNPQGLMWFIIDLSKVNLLSYNIKTPDLDKVLQVCPESGRILSKYLLKGLIFDLLNKFVDLNININGKKYNILKLYSDPDYTNKLVEDLIKIGNSDRSFQGFGYISIDEDIPSRSIGVSPLVGKVEIVNMKSTTYRIDISDYYLHPISNKQRISPPYTIQDIEIVSPKINQDILDKIKKTFCKALNVILDEIFIVKKIPFIKAINFVLNFSEFVLGREIIGCKKLECSERANRLVQNILTTLELGLNKGSKHSSFKTIFNHKSVIGKTMESFMMDEISKFLAGELSIVCDELPKIDTEFCLEITNEYLKDLNNAINCYLDRV